MASCVDRQPVPHKLFVPVKHKRAIVKLKYSRVTISLRMKVSAGGVRQAKRWYQGCVNKKSIGVNNFDKLITFFFTEL